MTDGERMLALARKHIGEKYVNVQVPKNNPNWKGPWDCAEFMSWLVYQVGGFLYGCLDDNADPALADAYTGAWKTDVQSKGDLVSVDKAASTVGGILLRYPPSPGAMGHIVVCDGSGGTVEAMGTAYGVRAGKIAGRVWDTGVFVHGLTYGAADGGVVATPPAVIYALGRPNMKSSVVKAIQRALKAAGVDPGGIDGQFGPSTATAVAAFQSMKGIIVDGQVGKQTAKRLGVTLS